MDKDDNHNNNTAEPAKQDKIYWHDAFYAALQLELHDYANALIFEDEHQLSKEALKMDVLVIKKTADVEINKNIGRIFKGHNIFEYKSETDNLTVNDYNKVFGYAMIYSAFEDIPIEDITISFVVTPKPIKLFEYLETKRRLTVTEHSPGIYYVEGDVFPIQIIESKKLSAAENLFLKHLRSNLTRNDMEEIFDAYRKYGALEKVNIYLNRIIDANEPILEEVLATMSATAQKIVYDHFEKNGWFDGEREKGQDKKARETALEMLKRGFDLEEVAEIIKMPIEWVQSLSN